MKKNIVILFGSPRKNGNTAALVRAFTEGAEAAGHTVTCFDLQRMDIHPCAGCMNGGKHPAGSPHPCVQRDDMDRIYPVYREADVVVLASPLYYWTISGQLKTAIDRLYAIEECDGRPVKACALLMAAAGSAFEAATAFYESMTSHLKWPDKGRVLAGGARTIDAVAHNAGQLAQARQLGEHIGD